ncbi:enediyne biosynthesis protein [Micromonospora sp. WMMD1128]|uniref:enediyne biosynthesis protein n=1 Tax=unclassified Micromonospora TaxID=2617518 RepID=UPI00248C5892|nr:MULTISPECIES: enediyne biosynthesis protein [unclassified Micromonospora]WBB75815.1 enediyne biosynthesis protein [Micromonospora sp. WMMD1128]WFE36395.1 enediyne biosynthesis protein [Micromonospora sp. WMMD975]
MTGKTARDPRVIALRNFAISITALNVLGYTVLGFEQAPLWPVAAVLTAYLTEIGLEVVGARAESRPPRFTGRGVRGVVEFLYPAHITALAVNMLLYVNDRMPVTLFAVMVAISGKWLLRAPVNGRLRHFMNPSNFGISVVLLLFPWVSIAPPYQFTEYLSGWADWALVVVIVSLGTLLNAKLTGRMWLIGSWLLVFAAQAVFRGLVLDTAVPGALATMTGVAFVLFTNYMVTDPGTTPSRPASQVAFGAGVAVVYGILTGASVVYGLFFATAIVCLVRGAFLWSLHLSRRDRRDQAVEATGRTAPLVAEVPPPALADRVPQGAAARA